MVEKTRRRRIRRSLKHRRRATRRQRGGALDVDGVLRKIQGQLSTYQWSEDPAQAFPLMSLEDQEIRAMLTSTEDRATQPGEQYISRRYAMQVPVLADDGSEVATTEDIRDVARTVHTLLTIPDSQGATPMTDREFQKWIGELVGQDDREIVLYLEQIERQIRKQLGVLDTTIVKFNLADEKLYPLYIWSLHANAGGEADTPTLFATHSEPAAPAE